eukprot:symbB.v1.2.026061.t1/scaffold2477.1/size83577/4
MCEGDRWTIAPSVSFPISDTAGESELPVADYEKSMALVTAATRTMQQKTSCATRPSEEPALDQPEQPARPAPDPNDQPDADATGHDHSKVSLEEMLGADKSDGEAGEADRFSKEAFQWAKSYNLGWKRGTRVPKKKKKKQHKGEGGKGNKDNGEAGEADQQKNTGAALDGAAPDDASHVDGGKEIQVKAAPLNKFQAQQLLYEGGISEHDVLNAAIDVMVMTEQYCPVIKAVMKKTQGRKHVKSKAKAAKGRQKGSKGKVKKKRAVTDAADDHLDGEGQGDIEQEEEHNEMGENIDIDTEDEAEAAYMDPEHAILDNDDDAIETAAGSLGVDVADNPAAFAANEIRIAHDHDAIAKAGLFPTSEEIMQEAEVLAASAHTAGTPEAELQEEALISIIRARSAGKRFPTHAASAAAATTTAMDDSGESTADEADRPVVMESMPAEQTGDRGYCYQE